MMKSDGNDTRHNVLSVGWVVWGGDQAPSSDPCPCWGPASPPRACLACGRESRGTTVGRALGFCCVCARKQMKLRFGVQNSGTPGPLEGFVLGAGARTGARGGEGSERPGGPAYPFGLWPRGRVLRAVGWHVGQVDLHIIRHLFQEVGGHQAFLPVQLPLHTGQRQGLVTHARYPLG